MDGVITLRQQPGSTYLNLFVEIAQLLAQLGVLRLALVVHAVLAAVARALGARLAARPAAQPAHELARQLRLHRRAHAPLLDRPLRVPAQLNQLRIFVFPKKARGQRITIIN